MRTRASSAWLDVGSPGSHATSFHTCQVLRPRRAVWVLAFTRPSVLPSAFATASAPGITIFARLNGWPVRSPTDASPPPLRTTAHGSGPMWFSYSFIVSDLHRLLVAGLPAHCERLWTLPNEPAIGGLVRLRFGLCGDHFWPEGDFG